MKRKIIVLTGIAGSGKSTIGSKIKSLKNIKHFSEIGREYRNVVACTTLDFCPLFDEVIMRRELERDEKILSLPLHVLPVVETWHIGNLSYAKLRSSKIYKRYLQNFKKQLKKFEVLAILIKIQNNTFEQRKTDLVNEGREQEHRQFYLKVGKGIKRIIDNHNIHYAVLEGEKSVHELTQQVIGRINSFKEKV
ncbi:hypothetical protein KKC83_01925 [Patescibacteria group bacterium]|nr:hypothetical protein [Candidatus Falkowbacteria bacterium]MBU3905599.1 hypothetical protein [Patescibacteria group bacterium]MBU4015792.1 hypothetical protein [Patescibacteria group bacterium]MBU4026284.1 hypothetical protein [Patescibacteria group bacterium]MBU4073070.1 hypothetical protein [Patescibacteria group bacterium]